MRVIGIEQRQAERRADVARFHERNVIWCCSEAAERCFDDCEALLAEVAALRERLRAAEEVVKAVKAWSRSRGSSDVQKALAAYEGETSPPDIATVAEQCAEIAERHGYDDAASAIRSAFPAKES